MSQVFNHCFNELHFGSKFKFLNIWSYQLFALGVFVHQHVLFFFSGAASSKILDKFLGC